MPLGHDTLPDSDAPEQYKRDMLPVLRYFQGDAYGLNADVLPLPRNVWQPVRDRRDVVSVPLSYFKIIVGSFKCNNNTYKVINASVTSLNVATIPNYSALLPEGYAEPHLIMMRASLNFLC